MNLRTIIAAAAAVLLLAGCATASTEANQAGVHYKGGMVQAKEFVDCIDPSTRSGYDPGDGYYLYPTRQVSYDAAESGGERGRFGVVSQDGADMLVPVSVTFRLKTDCETLRKFHETLGSKYAAYWEPDDNAAVTPDGWVDMLNFVVGKPLDAALDRVALEYNWQEMRTDPTVKIEMEAAMNEALNGENALITRQADGDFFEDFSVLVQKPDPKDPALLQSIADKQSRVADAEAQTAEAKAQVQTARAREALAEAEATEKRAIIDGYRLQGMTAEEAVDAYLRAQMIEKGLNPDQPTYIVGGTNIGGSSG